MVHMNSTTDVSFEDAHYHIIIPFSFVFIIIAIIVSLLILIIIFFVKQLHTVTHLLIGSGCVASIFYCTVQTVNYTYLSYVVWETSELSCRLRGYFGYMGMVAIIYSYLAQATSRYLVSIVSIRYSWAKSWKTHTVLVCIQWMIVIILPLPAIVTEDIYYRPYALCWVSKEYPLHLAYVILAYCIVPVLCIFIIYIYIYARIKRRKHILTVTASTRRSNRDMEVLYNIMILFAIYLVGALPTLIFILTKVEVFYTIGMISVSFAIATEKLIILFIDRDIRNTIKRTFYRSVVMPIESMV